MIVPIILFKFVTKGQLAKRDRGLDNLRCTLNDGEV